MIYDPVAEPLTTHEQQRVTDAVQAIGQRRQVIEQAKGILMLIYGIDADRAFDVLKWRSQVTNTKLQALAEKFVAEVTSAVPQSKMTEVQSACDNLLMTCQHRVDPDRLNRVMPGGQRFGAELQNWP